MKTPNEKYENDNAYRQLVDVLTALIHQAEFTPSEIREACMLACIVSIPSGRGFWAGDMLTALIHQAEFSLNPLWSGLLGRLRTTMQ